MDKAEKFKYIRENISIADYAVRSGYTLVRKGKYYSLKEHDSVMIDVESNTYWQNSIPGSGKCIGERGSVIDFAMRFNHMSCYEAIKEFEGMVPETFEMKKSEDGKKQKKENLILPRRDKNMRKVFAYLTKTRCITQPIVQEMVNRKMLYQDVYGNCVFVGYDIKNPDKPIFACRRGTNTNKPFYGDVKGCNYERCIYLDNGSNKLVVTESVIDAMSVMTLEGWKWKQYNYLVLSGVGKWNSVEFYLKNTDIKEIYIATDNDQTEENQGGIPCARCICSYVRENYPNVIRRWKLPPLKHGKDWNQVLQTMSNSNMRNEYESLSKSELDRLENLSDISRKGYGNPTVTVEQSLDEIIQSGGKRI